jgi:hypothetical protein
MAPVSDETTLGAPCDEGGEAPCFAHLLDDDGAEDKAEDDDEDEDDAAGAPAW